MARDRNPSATPGAPLRRWLPLAGFGCLCGVLVLGVASVRPGPKEASSPQPAVSVVPAPRPVWVAPPAAVSPPVNVLPAAWQAGAPGTVAAFAAPAQWTAPPEFVGQAQPVAAVQPVPAISFGQVPPHGDRGACEGCHTYLQPPTFPSRRMERARVRALVDPPLWATPVAAVQPALGVVEPTGRPRAAGSTNLPLQEAHWQGVEVIPATPALLKALGLTPNAKGVIADDVTLAADAAGLMGGDVVTSVGQVPTPNLESFIQATDRVRERSRAEVVVQRQGQVEPVILVVSVPGRLGTAQGEAAPMIPGGSVPPHRYQGPCTNCHRIGTTGQLPIDQGDLLTKKAPVIRAGWPPPHQDRGACVSCHEILP